MLRNACSQEKSDSEGLKSTWICRFTSDGQPSTWQIRRKTCVFKNKVQELPHCKQSRDTA